MMMMNSPLTNNDWPKEALPEKLIEWLFDQMLSKWGKQFVDKWSVVDPGKLKRDWAKALYGVSELEFRRGVAKMKWIDFPPSQPEFLKACRPEVHPTAAYSMAQLAAPENDKISREAAGKMLQELKATGPPPQKPGDGKDWARKILQRESRGEYIFPIQRQFARQALRTEGEEDA